MSHLVVELGGARRSLEVGAVQEVVRAAAISRVPAGPPWVRGLTAVRGRLVPVVDPGGGGARGSALVVIVTVGGRGVGLIVDRVEGVLESDSDALPPAIELAALGGVA